MSKIIELYVDTHRKAVVLKTNNNFVAIVDSLPFTTERGLYEEVLQFNEIDIVKRKIDVNISCFSDNYEYEVIEEAVCLKNQDSCTVISYIINIECLKLLECRLEEIIELIKCFASKY